MTQFNSYTMTHRGYELTFSADEKSCAISKGGVTLTTVVEHDEISWDGDDANQSTVTALVAAIRWIGDHRRGRTRVQPPAVVDSPLSDNPTEVDD